MIQCRERNYGDEGERLFIHPCATETSSHSRRLYLSGRVLGLLRALGIATHSLGDMEECDMCCSTHTAVDGNGEVGGSSQGWHVVSQLLFGGFLPF